MSNTAIFGWLVVIIAVVVGFLWLAPFGDPEAEVLNVEEEVEVFVPQTLAVDHFFADGVHTLDGSMELPTPCHSIEHEVTVSESDIMINFTTESSDELCTQVLTSKIFSVSFEAPEDALELVRATINGNPVELDVREGEESAIQKL